jgi:DNA helicase-2/ATP-dependent DNA helicase PcrA
MSLLDNLNPEQLQAVTLPNQHALVLAGAGSGKTKVLTTRIAWLIQTGNVSPHGLLAVTFTNKAAKEMLTRISAMLPINTRGMWVGTFHGLCNRLLRAHYREAALPQLFQILDTQDQLALLKRVMKAMNVDEDKFQPRQVQWFINGAKEEGRRAKDVEPYDDFSRRSVEIYAAYEEQCQREGAVDFAELLLRSYELLARNEPLREHYSARFRHILVDEFQDTNRLQYRWLKLLASGGATVMFAVGDDDQCVVQGTRITMADGTTKRVEQVRPGEAVRSGFGSRRFDAAAVTRVHRRTKRTDLVEVVTAGGRRLVSTPEHVHFAGYRLGKTPQTYFVYLMQKDGVGFRLGTSQVYTAGQEKPVVGFKQRALQEHADRLWIVATHGSENDARAEEMLLSLRYGIPTIPFVPRKGKAVNGLVHDFAHIRRIYESLDTEAAAARLMRDRHLSPEHPHHWPRSRDSKRRNITITLCGDRRGARPMHRIAIGGNDAAGKTALERLGLSVRPAKRASASWRFETCRGEYAEVLAIARRIRDALGGQLVLNANLGGKSLPYTRAEGIHPGMLMVVDGGEFDVVERVRRLPGASRTVFDLDVHPTHNYVANGVVTHNSIYAFRGANVGNMDDFRRDFRVENVIRLEQNYRSHGNILDAANALIAHNKRRLGKNLWTSAGSGEPLRVFEAQSDGYEAAWAVEEIQSLVRDGYARRDCAILYRSNAQSRVIEHALFSQGVPYKVYGGLRFFERLEVKHALAYLRLLANADDDSAFLRVVNFPTRGIGARSIEALQDAAKAEGASLWQAATRLSGKAGAAVGAFVRLVESMRSATAGLPLQETVEHVVHASGLLDHYKSERDGADRVENLEELVNAAAAFVQDESNLAVAPADGGAPVAQDPLAAFLSHAALESGESQAGEGVDAVQLMTVHSAKGLEFHAVFITGLEEGLFPHEQSASEDNGLEEERRLMYVAMTRARTRLYLSFSQTRLLHGQTRYNVASRFLDEVPKELVKWLTPKLGFGARPGRLDDKAWAAAEPPARYAAKPQQAGGSPFRIGQSVVHPKFGEGVVVNAAGQGADARLMINFGRHGMKELLLAYAKLEAA